MVSVLGNFLSSFIFGLLTPLGAVCVLPLFPAFLAFLSNSLGKEANRRTLALFGVVISAGVISFMMLVGIIFTTLLQKSLTNVVGVVSPIAFFILALISVLLILDIDFSRFLPHVHAPIKKNPLVSAFLFGFFFGAIVLPCNPGFIAAFFAKSILIQNPVVNLLNFLLFGIGLSFPLLVFSFLPGAISLKVINVLTNNKRKINLVAGLFMLGVSLYYLIFVFRVFGG